MTAVPNRRPRHPPRRLRLACLVLLALPGASGAEELDNGTDPTLLSRQVQATFEHTRLRNGFEANLLNLNFSQPFGEKRDSALRFRLPLASNNVLGSEAYRLGDATVQLTHVFDVTRTRGRVFLAEMSFDTADRPELGTGQNVFKGTYIHAFFLERGGIFAPAFVHNESLWGDDDRAKVRVSTVNLYYVPDLRDPRNLITLDSSVTRDWEGGREFAALAITFGRVIGPMFGGNGIVSVKPTLYGGGERPATWGAEVGFRVIGF
ncbi:MAG: hypothetical protein KA187_01530 [Arenimonas sp.]|nr:hypothetical protein [Arenimonas sp.]MBP6626075.1 hypothetical protein [Arenimonas sp.]